MTSPKRKRDSETSTVSAIIEEPLIIEIPTTEKQHVLTQTQVLEIQDYLIHILDLSEDVTRICITNINYVKIPIPFNFEMINTTTNSYVPSYSNEWFIAKYCNYNIVDSDHKILLMIKWVT